VLCLVASRLSVLVWAATTKEAEPSWPSENSGDRFSTDGNGYHTETLLISTKLTKVRKSVATDLERRESSIFAAGVRSSAWATNLAEMEAVVMDQVKQSMLTANYQMPDEIRSGMLGFKINSSALIDDLTSLHNIDQIRIDNAIHAMRDCKKDLATWRDSVQQLRVKHDTCRTDQAARYDSMKGSCQNYSTAQKNAGPPPNCSLSAAAPLYPWPDVDEAFDTCFHATHQWQSGLWDSHEGCRMARQVHTLKKEECDSLQRDFESAVCDLASNQTSICSCFDGGKCKYEAVRAEVVGAEKSRRASHASIVRLGCHIDFMIASSTDDGPQPQECEELDVNTTHLIINYSLPVPPESCESVAPCGKVFLEEEYTNKAWHKNAPAAECVPCPAPAITESSLFGGSQSMMALNRESGKGVCWGRSGYGADCSGEDFTGITDVFATCCGFMAVNTAIGRGFCWGRGGHGGDDCSDFNFTGDISVSDSPWQEGFMVVNRATGKGFCWGQGGGCTDEDFIGTTDVYAGSRARLFLNKAAGTGHCVGLHSRGGLCGHLNFTGVTDVYTTERAFFALDKTTGRGFCWGADGWGGNCTGKDFTGVTDVYTTMSTFLALDKVSGRGFCWGGDLGSDCSHQNFSGITDVYSAGAAYMALNKKSGQGFCWGSSRFGGDCSGLDFTGITEVHGSKLYFTAVNQATGRHFCWGDYHSINTHGCNKVDLRFLSESC